MLRTKTKTEDGNKYEMTKFCFRCDVCKDVIESSSIAPTKCKCGNLAINGGIYYGGVIACFYDCITDLSEWKLVTV